MSHQTIGLDVHMKAVTDMRQVNTRLRKQIHKLDEHIDFLDRGINEARLLLRAFLENPETTQTKMIAKAWLEAYGDEKE